MTAEEERAADYLASRARRAAYERKRARGLRGDEAARRDLAEAWDAVLPDGAQEYEPARLTEARRQASGLAEDDGESGQWV